VARVFPAAYSDHRFSTVKCQEVSGSGSRNGSHGSGSNASYGCGPPVATEFLSLPDDPGK